MSSDEQAKILLHWLNGSRAQTIIWMMAELDISYEIEVNHRLETKQAPPALQKIHPLGKAPLVTVTPTGDDAQPFVLAETSFIVQWLCDHFAQGSDLVPERWKKGREGKIGGETEAWLRYQYLFYYVEGSLMSLISLFLVMDALRGPAIPFFLRPITGIVVGKVVSLLVFPELQKHLKLLESYLDTSPDGGNYICGSRLTAADVLMAFPLMAIKGEVLGKMLWDNGSPETLYPKFNAYVERMEKEPGFIKMSEKVKEVDGEWKLLP